MMARPKDKRRSGPAEAARLRDDIDRGAGDKTAFLDPAAAPLGTDDEASGHPPTRAQTDAAHAHETRPSDRAEVKPSPGSRQGRTVLHSHLAVFIGGLVLAALIGFVLWLL